MAEIICIVLLGIVGLASWYSFLWQLAKRSNEKRREAEEVKLKKLMLEHAESEGVA